MSKLVGALKPNKVKARKVTKEVSGHMPIKGPGGFGTGGKLPLKG